jgi:hypothetical protein
MKKIFQTELDKVEAAAAQAWQYGATPSEVATAAKKGVRHAMGGGLFRSARKLRRHSTVRANGWRRRQAAQTRRRSRRRRSRR